MSSPTIGGSLVSGATLVALPGTWYGLEPTAYLFEWLRCDDRKLSSCNPNVGGAAAAYVAKSTDVGHFLRVRARAVSGVGTAEASTSAPFGPVQTANLSASARLAQVSAPVISGRPRVGEAVEASAGVWTSTTSLVDCSFNWFRCPVDGSACVKIPGAVTDTYDPNRQDVGSRLKVEVSGKFGTSAPEVVESDQTQLVSAPASALPATSTDGAAVANGPESNQAPYQPTL